MKQTPTLLSVLLLVPMVALAATGATPVKKPNVLYVFSDMQLSLIHI